MFTDIYLQFSFCSVRINIECLNPHILHSTVQPSTYFQQGFCLDIFHHIRIGRILGCFLFVEHGNIGLDKTQASTIFTNGR